MDKNNLIRFLFYIYLVQVACSIKFNYRAQKHELICFHEDIQKQTRYQVVIKSDKSNYSLQLLEEQVSVYEDNRQDMYLKQYSAFAQKQGILLICLANKDIEEGISYQIQFYHGSHLEGLMNELDSDSFSQLQDIYGQCFQIQNFVKNAYQMNVRTLLERNIAIGSLPFLTTVGTLVFLIVLILSRTLLISRLKKMMRRRKLI